MVNSYVKNNAISVTTAPQNFQNVDFEQINKTK